MYVYSFFNIFFPAESVCAAVDDYATTSGSNVCFNITPARTEKGRSVHSGPVVTKIKMNSMRNLVWMVMAIWFCSSGCAQDVKNSAATPKLQKLTAEEERVILHKGTEAPFSGKYNNFFEKGTYVCRQCGAALYTSADKFKSECGWPSFDSEIRGAVKRTPDPDGMRTEISCVACGAHLGHVFVGEELTPKNTRHCVNSVSLVFVPARSRIAATDTAIVAGGCFWGVEYYMHKIAGVSKTEAGYIGGHLKNPTYKDVCSHTTGYAEAVRVVFDPSKTSYEAVVRMFFEIHDPTQINRQGPDVGDQYRSEVFYLNNGQKETTERLIGLLTQKGFRVATKVTMASTFWRAEDFHQQYYEKEGQTPYCHGYVKRF
jgi:peptide methionine sulfoxide reductase msrA/msrB